MKICMIEACEDSDRGSIGAWYIVEHARRIGYNIDMLKHTKKGYDVEMISVHHCSDFERLAVMPKRAKIRIVGGHPMQNNPRPIIPFADVICIGEGESWIKRALPLLDVSGIEALANLPGTILSKFWRKGTDIPAANFEDPLPDNPPYLNRPGTLSAAWYVEIARGCPYSCTFCELGNSLPYRMYTADHIKHVLTQTDTKQTRKINFYAPDEAAHPQYQEMFDYLMEHGYMASFSSMRVDSILRHGLPALKTNVLIRVGIDGLTESTRRKVNKNITNDMIVEYFARFIERGHIQFKIFFIIGYPWESNKDFAEFEYLMRCIFALPLKKNISLRIKWTPLIPQPCTPLGNVNAQYDLDMMNKINIWHALYKRPNTEPGWYVENDGLMSWKSHKRQCQLTSGDENILIGYPGAKPIHRMSF